MGAKFFSGLFQPSSSMYNDRLLKVLKENRAFSSPLEAFAVQDMGMRFIYQYELSLVACMLLRNSRSGMHFFHKTLVLCSFAIMMAMAWLQTLHFRSDFTPFEPNFFARMVLSHLFAISFSIWTMSLKKNRYIHKPPYIGGRWSIPGIALFIGSVSQDLSDQPYLAVPGCLCLINALATSTFQVASFLAVVASVQALVEDHGLEVYFGNKDDISQIVVTSFMMGVVHLAIHSFLLFRLRYDIMTVKQLKSLCLYKLIVNVMIPFFSISEFDNHLSVDRRMTVALRIALALTYASGYWFAGTGDKVSNILACEKAD